MRKISDITAVILAGGLGTRLRSVVSNKPKALAEVLGRPFMSFLLDQIEQAKLNKVVICTGYMAEEIEQEFGQNYRKVKLFYSKESSPLGTAGALRLALPLIATEYVLVMNGDSYIKAELINYINWFLERNIKASLLLTRLDDTSRYGSVKLCSDGKILEFIEKFPDSGEGLINAGIYLMERNIVEKIPHGQPCSLERDIFPILTGGILHGFVKSVDFIDIGVPISYNNADNFFQGLV